MICKFVVAVVLLMASPNSWWLPAAAAHPCLSDYLHGDKTLVPRVTVPVNLHKKWLHLSSDIPFRWYLYLSTLRLAISYQSIASAESIAL